MRTKADSESRSVTFTGLKRSEQLVSCAIDAIVDLGFQRASVAEVARRAGASKGVVTYHFRAKEDLILAVVAPIFDSVKEHLEARLVPPSPATFVPDYINAWVEYYRSHGRNMLALREIWGGFRDESGQHHFGPEAVAGELAAAETMLQLGQDRGYLRPFSARIMAITIKGALDNLLNQLARDPGLDLEAYGAELVDLFEHATRCEPGAGPARRPRED